MKEIEKRILQILSKRPEDKYHAERVLYWILKINPSSELALQIAALAHDIDRCIEPVQKNDYDNYDEYKKQHAIRSAQYASDIALEFYDEGFALEVYSLIKDHEVGGGRANFLRDADSIAFFEHYMPWYLNNRGAKKTKMKIEYMYARVSEDAKAIIKSIIPKELKNIFEQALRNS